MSHPAKSGGLSGGSRDGGQRGGNLCRLFDAAKHVVEATERARSLASRGSRYLHI